MSEFSPRSQLPPGFQPPAGLDAPAQPGCLLYLLFAAAGAWVIVVSLLVQGIAWVTDQVLLIEGTPLPGWAWTAISLGHALLLALPVVPLALLSRAPRFRAVYQTWAWAIGFMALLSLARIFPVTWTQAAALAQIILSLAATAALLALNRRQLPLAIRSTPLPIPIVALIFGVLMLAPWLYYGALGSPLDTLLGLLAGLSLGLFAGTLLDKCLIAPFSSNANRSGSDIPFGGTAAGIALLILVAGFGFGGTQLLLMLCIPALGFATMALGRAADPGRGWLPIVALVGLAVAAPLMLLDPDELMLILDPELNEIIGWMLRAAGLALLIAWALGLLLWAAGDRIRRAHPAGLVGSGLVAFSMLVFFAFSARAGFYGDRIFVILRDQADVSTAATISDREERLRTVYTTLTQHADTTQADLRATLDQLGVDYQPYYLVNAIEVDGGPLLRAYLARRPEVDRILDSPRLRPLPAPVSAAPGQVRGTSGVLWNIRMIGADRVWEDFGITGEGIVVGQSDSGVAGEHPALRDGYRGRGGQDDYNWLDPWNHTVSPSDGGGHGTHTLGSAVGRNGIGVAPGAEWFGCVNLGRNIGNPALYLTCMQFMLAPYPQDGDPLKDGVPARAAHVINNSWGCPELEGCDVNALAPATGALRAAGIFVVASAGNEGPRCSSIDDPIAIYDTVFSVGAMDEFGDVASFSSRGPVTVDGSGRIKPDLLAPGVDIVSAWPDGGYEESSGTSMAGPHIAGVVALLWSAQPALIGDIDRTTEILIETAQPYTGEREGCFEGDIPNGAYGHGVVDVYAAVEAALALP